MNHYEGLFILNIQGKEEGLKDVTDQIENEIQALGGKVTGTQKMDRRRFENVAQHLDSGYYLGMNIQLEPAKVNELTQKLKLNEFVFRSFFVKVEKKTEEKAESKKKAKASTNA